MGGLKRISITAVFALCNGLPLAHSADQAQSDTTQLQEVIVTAEKRAESAQTVPMSITTLTAATLQQQDINNFLDYGTRIPNLGFAYTGDGVGTSRTISIRGISGDGTTGFYIDDTPLPDSLDPRILDIDHIEVLRGPQGTLFGARSMGGTVRIITQGPNYEEFSATIHGFAGDTDHSDRGDYEGDAVVNIPLITDRIALRLSGFYDAEAGWLKRRYCTDPATAGVTCFPLTTSPSLTTTVGNVGATNTYGGNAELDVKLSDSVTVTPRLMQQRTDMNGFPMSDVDSTNNAWGYPYPYPGGVVPLPTLKPDNLTQGRFFNIPEGGYDSWDLYSLTLKWQSGLGELVSASSYFDRVVLETEDETDFIYDELLPAVSANPLYPNIPGFPAGAISPTTGLPLPIASAISEEKDYQQFMEELRFVSQLRGPFQYVAGFFYSDLHGAIPFAAIYPPALAPGYGAELTTANTCALVGLCVNPNDPDEIFGEHYHTDQKEPAFFGELSYQATDQLKGTVGMRWSQVTTTAGGYQEGSVTQSPGAAAQIVNPDETTRETAWTPKLQVDYQIDPDAMVYSLVGKGFRPGGLVPSVPPALCAGELPSGVTVDDTRSYNSDSLWNYEIGTKTEWLDHSLILNAAAFWIDWKDIQQWILLPCGFQYKANAGAAQSKGGEIELDAKPLNHLSLAAGVGYQDAKITGTGPDSPQQPGSPVFEVPDWTVNETTTWTQPVWTGWSLLATASYSYVGNSYSANNLNALEPLTRLRPAYELVDSRVALDHGIWEFALVGKNLTDTLANLADSRSIAAEVPGRPRLLMTPPRTVGLEVRASF